VNGKYITSFMRERRYVLFRRERAKVNMRGMPSLLPYASVNFVSAENGKRDSRSFSTCEPPISCRCCYGSLFFFTSHLST
jgi:hypothetical protein